MALSDKEQQLLAQMEAALAADDPKLAHTLGGGATRSLHKRGVTIAIVGLLAGVVLLIAGMSSYWFVSVAGFIVMLASTALALRSWRLVPSDQEHQSAPEADPNFLRGLDDKRRRHPDDGIV